MLVGVGMGVEEGAAPSPQWRGRGTGELYVLRLLLKAVPRGGCELSLPAALRLQAAGLGQQTGSAGLGAGQDRGRGGGVPGREGSGQAWVGLWAPRSRTRCCGQVASESLGSPWDPPGAA